MAAESGKEGTMRGLLPELPADPLEPCDPREEEEPGRLTVGIEDDAFGAFAFTFAAAEEEEVEEVEEVEEAAAEAAEAEDERTDLTPTCEEEDARWGGDEAAG